MLPWFFSRNCPAHSQTKGVDLIKDRPLFIAWWQGGFFQKGYFLTAEGAKKSKERKKERKRSIHPDDFAVQT
jgi:hypothetical protein